MRARHLVVLLAILAVSAAGTVYSQRRLDELRPAEGFQEMMYLPRGWALKIIAFGFDAPLADWLYIKGHLYWSENSSARLRGELRKPFKFIHDIFDAATDLNPHFREAYVNGAYLVAGTGVDRAEMAIDLLEKGIEVFPEDYRLYVQAGSVCMVQLDNMERAREYYRQAVRIDEIPRHLVQQWLGIENKMRSDADVSRLQKLEMQIAQWRAVLEDEEISEEVIRFAEEDLKRLRTARAEQILTRASRKHLQAQGALPSPRELHGELLSAEERRAVEGFPFYEGDRLARLPDGTVRSLARVAAWVGTIDRQMRQTVAAFKHRNDRPPRSMEELAERGMIRRVPEHPLAPLGYELAFDLDQGGATSVPPIELAGDDHP
jgi:tetratricopeptide (TPR) repeat protein